MARKPPESDSEQKPKLSVVGGKVKTNKPDAESMGFPPPKAAARKPGPDDEEPLGAVDDDPRMDGLSQRNRRTEELEAAMRAVMNGEPKFPYPPELPEHHKPYWLQLVNSFQADHFQVSDLPMMKLYCRAAYDIERISLKIDEEGEVVFGAKGQPMVNPRVKVRTDAQVMLMAITTKFRNQPASRVNSENHKNRQGKAQQANRAAEAMGDDEDDLLAGSDMRH